MIGVCEYEVDVSLLVGTAPPWHVFAKGEPPIPAALQAHLHTAGMVVALQLLALEATFIGGSQPGTLVCRGAELHHRLDVDGRRFGAIHHRVRGAVRRN